MFQTVITLRNTLAIECVSLNDVSTRIKVSLVDALDDLWLSQNKEIIIVLKLLDHILEAITYQKLI
jgi:hypothetical protein